MDRRTRKDLKTDKFAQEVGLGVQFLAGHKLQATRYAAIGVAVLLVIAGYWFYSSRQASARAKALADAIHVSDGVISATPSAPSLNFATQADKDKAVAEAYSKVAAEYRGTQEGAIAQLYVAAGKTDKGQTEEAIKLYRDVADSAPNEYKRVAQVALAQLLASQNQIPEAEKLLESVAQSSSALVSKEEAMLAHARILAKSDPAKARKLLEPLRDARTAISSAAITALATLPPAPAEDPAKGAKAPAAATKAN